jgi:hypothetical protein
MQLLGKILTGNSKITHYEIPLLLRTSQAAAPFFNPTTMRAALETQ